MNSLSKIGVVLLIISALVPYSVPLLSYVPLVGVALFTIGQPLGLVGIVLLIIGYVLNKLKNKAKLPL